MAERGVKRPAEGLVTPAEGMPVGMMINGDAAAAAAAAVAAVGQGVMRPSSGSATPLGGMPAGDGEPAPKKRARVRFADGDDEEGGG